MSDQLTQADQSEPGNSQPLTVEDRVHIVPLGYEFDRVVTPLVELRADKVIFLKHVEDGGQQPPYHDWIYQFLKHRSIETVDIQCSIFDLYQALGTIAEQITRHRDDDVYVNLSSGSKLTAIGGMIACMTEDATAYYLRADIYGEDVVDALASDDRFSELVDRDLLEESHPVAHSARSPVEIPAYPIDHPSYQDISVMEYLERVGSADKGQIIEFAKETGLPFLEGLESSEGQGEYRRLESRVLRSLREDGYIDVTEKGRKKVVSLTERGQQTLEAFQYMI